MLLRINDDVNNTGLIDPITATEAAMQFDIKIYTIELNKAKLICQLTLPNGSVKYDYLPVMIDEELLTEISKKMTNGKYYRAKDR
ncbi:MAG: hypothetical protein R2772_02150 [Chitinophagales bacterium]